MATNLYKFVGGESYMADVKKAVGLPKYCDACKSTDLIIAPKGPHMGLYCNDCSCWIKWVSDNDIQIAKSRGYNICGERSSNDKKQVKDDKDNIVEGFVFGNS